MAELPDALAKAEPKGPDLMGREIAQGPDAVEVTLAIVEALASQIESMLAPAHRIVLSATGASLAAARIAAPLWRARLAGATEVVVRQSTEAALGDLDGLAFQRSDLVVVISQSGSSPETLAAARQGGHAGASVLALTAHMDSPLAAAAALTVELGSGREEGAATKSELASLAALLAISGVVETDAASRMEIRDGLRAVIATWDEAREPGRVLNAASHAWLVGFGAALGIAEAGILMWHEKVVRPAAAATPSEFRHGLIEAATNRDAVLLIDVASDTTPPSAYLERLRSELQTLGVSVVELRPRASNPGTAVLELLLRIQQLSRAAALAGGTYRDGFAVLRHTVTPANDLFA